MKTKLPKNTIINGLKIDKQLGKGRYGVVYLAYPETDKDKEQPVCLKYCGSKEEAEKEVELGYRYFERREAVFPGKLAILNKEKVFSQEGKFICILPFIAGTTLENVLKNDKYSNIDDWLTISKSFLTEMLINKSASQLHRDSHTENAMVIEDKNGKPSVVLIDFGLSVNTNSDIRALSFRPVFDAVLKCGFLSTLAMKTERYAQRIAPEHQTIKSTSNVGFRSDSFSVGYIFAQVLLKIESLITSGKATPTEEQKKEIKKLYTAMTAMRAPVDERMGLEEAFLTLSDDEQTAIDTLKLLLGSEQPPIEEKRKGM